MAKKPKTYKVVYNACFGGFGISEKALRRLRELDPSNKDYGPGEWYNTFNGEKYRGGSICKEKSEWVSYMSQIKRHDPNLIKVIEELGEEANGSCANLKIKTIRSPLYKINVYDGSNLS